MKLLLLGFVSLTFVAAKDLKSMPTDIFDKKILEIDNHVSKAELNCSEFFALRNNLEATLGHQAAKHILELILKHGLSIKIKEDLKWENMKDAAMKYCDFFKDEGISALISTGPTLYRPTELFLRPSDCSDLLMTGYTTSQMYDIYPYRCRCTKPIKVYCDMDTNGGGWTVILARAKSSKPLNFTRNWEEYKKGFSNFEKEYWIGNEHLHRLTFGRNYIVRLEAKDTLGREMWGEWSNFRVDSEINRYKLTATEPNPLNSAADWFNYHTGQNFTTYDSDDGGCAVTYKGGWWYKACHVFNPTGLHGDESANGIRFNPGSKSDKNFRYADWLQLKIRPAICGELMSTAEVNTHNCL